MKIDELIEKINNKIKELKNHSRHLNQEKISDLSFQLTQLQSIQSEQQEMIDALNELVIFLDSINLYNADRIAKLRLDTTRYKKLLEKITRKNLNEK